MEKKKPEIRFNGFEGEWTTTTLGECFLERVERSAEGELISVTISQGVVRASDLDRIDNSSNDKSNYKVVEVGDIAYNSMRMWQGACGYSLYKGICSPAYTVVIPQNNIDVVYCFYLFKRNETLQLFRVNSQGLTSDTWNLKYPAFSQIKCSFPSLSEQEKIGVFLTTLDKLIAKLEAKLDKLRKLKQALLEKMFINVNRGGYETSEIRFKGYTDKWQVKELREVAEFAKGKGYSKGDLTKEGIPIIRYGSLYTDYRTEIDSVSEYVQYSEGAIFSRGGEVIIPASGETSEDIARASAIKLPSVIIGGDLNIIYPNAEIDAVFLALEITYGKSHTYLAMKAQGASVVHLRKLDISTLSPKFSSLSEQEQIGKCFTQIDTHFNKTSTKLTKLRNIKQSLLQKMFA